MSSVWVLEDEPHIARYLEFQLAKLSFSTKVFGDGRGFHDFILESAPPDLVLLDLNVPGLNGKAIFSEIRRHFSSQPVPVIILSANLESSFGNGLVNDDFTVLLDKPISPRKLSSSIRALLKASFPVPLRK